LGYIAQSFASALLSPLGEGWSLDGHRRLSSEGRCVDNLGRIATRRSSDRNPPSRLSDSLSTEKGAGSVKLNSS
jgi:hypothetical protein